MIERYRVFEAGLFIGVLELSPVLAQELVVRSNYTLIAEKGN